MLYTGHLLALALLQMKLLSEIVSESVERWWSFAATELWSLCCRQAKGGKRFSMDRLAGAAKAGWDKEVAMVGAKLATPLSLLMSECPFRLGMSLCMVKACKQLAMTSGSGPKLRFKTLLATRCTQSAVGSQLQSLLALAAAQRGRFAPLPRYVRQACFATLAQADCLGDRSHFQFS